MCVDMLLAFAQRPNIAQEITRSFRFTPLMMYFTSNIHRFPESIHGSMIEALAVLCCHSSSEEHERGFTELKSLILINIAQVVQDREFSKHFQDSRVISRLLDGLDMLDGIISAANLRNMDMLFDLLFEVQPFFEQMLSIYAYGQDIPRKIIQIVESASRYLDMSSLPDNGQMIRFSLNIRSVLQKYEHSYHGSTTYEPSSDTETLTGITTLVQAMSYLVHNEMGFAPNELDRQISREVSDSFGETEIFGLYCIHKTSTHAQIAAPNVMRVYMQMLSDLIQFRTPSLVRWLPADTWKSVINLLICGVDNDIYDVEQRTYEAISKLGAYVKLVGLGNASPELHHIFSQGIKQLLTKLFSALLFSPFDSQLVESAGTALITLGFIDSAHMHDCFRDLLVQGGSSAAFAERLSTTFTKFNQDLEACDAVRLFLSSTGPIPDPIDGTSLRQPLFEFLVRARAVIRVK
ncbi:hypothetical protein LPJ73_004895 [Coemansia sp. RSA 2703]|nr:hypothetical protein LPJ73_004895 [Coemansia sp. RSA 2703]